jgi:hypothetical protein
MEQTGLDDLKMTRGSLCWVFACGARQEAKAVLEKLVLPKVTMYQRLTLEESAVVCRGGMRDCLALGLVQTGEEP